MTHDDRSAAIWLQRDAAYLYAQATKYREQGRAWMATLVQDNAAHSARLARQQIGLEPKETP
jgi:hypothetical protein